MPTTTTGVATTFIDFTRASNATVTDSDGLVKWAPHNLLTNSESFDAAAWALLQGSSTLPTVVANAAAAPNGTITADRINFGAIASSSAYSQIQQLFTSDTAPYTFGFWIKAVAAGDVGKKVWFDLQTSASPAAFKTITITADWQFVSTIGGLTSGSNRSATFYTVGGAYGGEIQGAVSVYVWGAHVYRSDLGGMQPNTSAYPLYNPTTPKNLLGYTEDFSNAAWAKSNILAFGSGSVANAAIAPNGLQTADLLVESTANGQHIVEQFITRNGATSFTASVYAKAKERSAFVLTLQDGSNTGPPYAVFNLTAAGSYTVSSGTSPASASATASISSVGDGWYRCSISAINYSQSSVYVVACLSNSTSPTLSSFNRPTYTGDGTSGIYLWGAQLSDSASLDSYSPVYGAAVTSAAYYGPRRDFDGATLACKGLLVEEQRTNFITQSAAFDQPAWFSQAFGAGAVLPTVTPNTVIAPDGIQTADTISFGSVSSGSINRLLIVSSEASGSKTFTGSVWLRVPSGTATVSLMFDDSSGGNTVGSEVKTVTTTWTRFTITATQNGAQVGNARFGILQSASSTLTAFDLYAWGAQVELGSFATSYIPTGAATATRNADVASVSTQAFPYSATEGTVVVYYDSNKNSGNVYGPLVLSDGTPNNRVTILGNYPTLQHVALVNTAGLEAANLTTLASSPVGNPVKTAVAFKQNDFAASSNGGTVATDNSGSVPAAATELGLGYFYPGAPSSNYLNGHIRQITYLPRRISNAELQTRTS